MTSDDVRPCSPATRTRTVQYFLLHWVNRKRTKETNKRKIRADPRDDGQNSHGTGHGREVSLGTNSICEEAALQFATCNTAEGKGFWL